MYLQNKDGGTRAHRQTLRKGQYLHSDTEVHHGHAGVAVPADVHGGVATVALTLQGGARAAELLLRLQLAAAILQQLCEDETVSSKKRVLRSDVLFNRMCNFSKTYRRLAGAKPKMVIREISTHKPPPPTLLLL